MRISLHLLSLWLLFFIIDCPDPCLSNQRACNEDRDCAAGEHCIRPGSGSLTCSLVKGTCEDLRRCHHQEDCADSQCCDLYSQVCAPKGACTGTCNIALNQECPPDQLCDEQSGRCHDKCSHDSDCGPLQICGDIYGCTQVVGTPCGSSFAVVQDCGEYMMCVSPVENGEQKKTCQLGCDYNNTHDHPCPHLHTCTEDNQCEPD